MKEKRNEEKVGLTIGSDFGMGPGIGYLFPLGDGNATLDLGFEFHNVSRIPKTCDILE